LLNAVGKRDPRDPRMRVDEAMGEALFSPRPDGGPPSILSDSLDGVDRPLLYAAIRMLLKNQDARVRSLLVPTYRMLTPEDVAALLPDIVEAIRTPAPSGKMYGYYIRVAGVELLAKWRIREGMALCADLASECEWGRRIDECINPLTQYGSGAREIIPRLHEVQEIIAKSLSGTEQERAKDRMSVEKLIARIEADQNEVPLRGAREFIANPPKDP
jgi:hypothetical protein